MSEKKDMQRKQRIVQCTCTCNINLKNKLIYMKGTCMLKQKEHTVREKTY